MLLQLLISAQGPRATSHRKGNEDYVGLCRCVCAVCSSSHGMQWIIACWPPPVMPFLEGIVLYVIYIGTLDFTHLIQETVKHLLHVSYLFLVNILVSSQNWPMVMLSAGW